MSTSPQSTDALLALLASANRPVQCITRKPDSAYQTSIFSGYAEKHRAYSCGSGWTIPESIADAMHSGGLAHLLKNTVEREDLLG